MLRRQREVRGRGLWCPGAQLCELLLKGSRHNLEVMRSLKAPVRTKEDKGLRMKLGALEYSEGRREAGDFEEDGRSHQRGTA